MVEIYDTTTWEAVRTFAAHSAEVWDVNWSPDGTRLVSGDYAGNAYVWDFATGEIVQRFSIGQEVITSVDWSPYGEYVAAVGGSFGTLVIRRAWQSTQELIDYAKECCAFRELTAEERAQFGLP